MHAWIARGQTTRDLQEFVWRKFVFSFLRGIIRRKLYNLDTYVFDAIRNIIDEKFDYFSFASRIVKCTQ